MRLQAKIRGASAVYDSRVEIWAARIGHCPEEMRAALKAGQVLCFDRNGVEVHRIRPGQLV